MIQNRPLVSVIMPAYNAEKTVKRAVESVLGQTYSKIELIVVNDGSTDNTFGVLQNFSDTRIKVVNQNNAGLADARNTGLDNVNGEYVTFIDSDDWYEADFVEKMLASVIQNESQMSVCGIRFHNEQGTKCSSSYDVTYESLFDNISFLSILETGIMNSVCNKIFDTNKIREYQLRFRNLAIVEDLDFNMRFIDIIKRISFIPSFLYNYDNNYSVLTKNVSQEMFDNYIHLHAWLFSRVPTTSFYIISKFIFHQYFAFALKYTTQIITKQKRLKEVAPIWNFYFANPLICHSFESYTPSSWGEKLLVGLLRHRQYRLFVCYYRILRLLDK